MAEALEIIKDDVKDAPYVACCLALKCDGIWTSDAHYSKNLQLKTFETEYLLKLM
jgi:predicted nucleic acid-binding protein